MGIYLEEINEREIICPNNVLQFAAVWDPQDALLIVLDEERRVVVVKVVLLLAAAIYKVRARNTANFHYEFKLFLLVVSREEWLASEELSKDAAQTPYVNLLCV